LVWLEPNNPASYSFGTVTSSETPGEHPGSCP
jgi:hypothetical protein